VHVRHSLRVRSDQRHGSTPASAACPVSTVSPPRVGGVQKPFDVLAGLNHRAKVVVIGEAQTLRSHVVGDLGQLCTEGCPLRAI